jgi:AcrR family transcriptional regulator
MGSVAVRSAEGEREELMWAMALVAGRRGYAGTSVAEVIEEAGSARAGFGRHFADKQECFAAAQEMLAGRALEAVRESMEAEAGWLARVLAGLRRAVELCGEHPKAGRALLVCPVEAGAEGQRRRLAMSERFAELIEPEAELAEELPPRAALMAVCGVIGLLAEELGRGAAADLVGLAPELGFALLVPLLGPVVAGEELERAAALTAATT